MVGGKPDRLSVELAFATPARQTLLTVEVEAGATVAEVIARSGIDAQYPDFDFDAAAVGIWGRVVERDNAVSEGDRVEIYRPLSMNPREARRRLAASGRTMRDGEGGD